MYNLAAAWPWVRGAGKPGTMTPPAMTHCAVATAQLPGLVPSVGCTSRTVSPMPQVHSSMPSPRLQPSQQAHEGSPIQGHAALDSQTPPVLFEQKQLQLRPQAID